MIGYGGYRRKQGSGYKTSPGIDQNSRIGERLGKRSVMQTHLATSMLPKSWGNRVEDIHQWLGAGGCQIPPCFGTYWTIVLTYNMIIQFHADKHNVSIYLETSIGGWNLSLSSREHPSLCHTSRWKSIDAQEPYRMTRLNSISGAHAGP